MGINQDKRLVFLLQAINNGLPAEMFEDVGMITGIVVAVAANDVVRRVRRRR